MKPDLRKVFHAIVEEGVLNKYPELGRPQIARAFNSAWGRISGLDTELSVTAQLRKIRKPEDDVNNQVTILQLIHRFWSQGECLEAPLATLNSGLFGSMGRARYRSSNLVADYGGEIPTPKGGVMDRLDELERLCRHTVNLLGSSCIEGKALQLAYIHGAVIRVHPFEDGNGRTARLFIQYALLTWGLVPTQLPKVRNDPSWARAMDQAVDGDARALQRELLARICKANGLKGVTREDSE